MFIINSRNKIKLMLAMFILALSLSIHSNASAEVYLSGYAGAFTPSSDYSDSWNSAGTDLGLSYVMINEYAGFEVALHTYKIDAVEPFEDSILGTGLDFLVHFQQENVTFQPFAAFGLGYIKTTLTSPLGDEKSDGLGVLMKLGARYFITKNLFISGYFKRFKNNADIIGFSGNLGGDAIIIEAGIVSF